MQKPGNARNEDDRLQVLRSLDVLDTLTEERFDQLTRMAKRLFRVPIAVVSLVDANRVWFKSCIGLGGSESSRDESFCGHAILGDEILVIPDALEDIRFADNPFVLTEPCFRFYAGCPLTVRGYKLGTLCVIDLEPRDFDAEDVATLKDLAAMVERELTAVQMATIDELTNISNRRGFMTLANQMLHLCARQNIPAALVFLDLDKFKFINDHFGHEEGDRALLTFAKQMTANFRASDTLARLGGDEFVVLLTNTTKAQAEALTEKFKQSLIKSNEETCRGYEILFSHGIMEFFPDKHSDIKDLLTDSDKLMFELKREKKSASLR
jgi:diguanylate cyclase (GGDEF)-like protein